MTGSNAVIGNHMDKKAFWRGVIIVVLAALLATASILPAAAQTSLTAQPYGAAATNATVRYIGMREGIVGEPFVLAARVRDGLTARPLAGAPVQFVVGAHTVEAISGPDGVASTSIVLTPELAGADISVRATGQPEIAMLAEQTNQGGVSVANVGAAQLVPTAITETIAAGQSITVSTQATLPLSAQAPGDIIFAFDTTESMGSYLPAAQALADDMMLALAGNGLDVRYAAVEFQDYPGAFSSFGYAPATGYGAAGSVPYAVAQPLTAVQGTVAAAIYALSASTGDNPGDPAGSYSRVLFESTAELTPAGADPAAGALGYRPDARRMVVLFGDDLPHDNDLNQGVPGASGTYSTGGDPGRDGILQETSNPANIGAGNDDLDLQTVLAAMQANGVSLISYDLNPFNSAYWSAWAGATGGEHVYDYDAAVAAMLARLRGQAVAASVSIRGSAGFEGWVRAQPAGYTNVPLPAAVPFAVAITPPAGTPPGVYRFNVELVNDGGVVARQAVTITVPGATNRAPNAVADNFNVNEDSTGNALNVLANDSDPDGSALVLTAATQPGNGAVTLADGIVRYTPNPNYNGQDSFTYTVSDGVLAATATVSLTVLPVNDPPNAGNDAFEVDRNSSNNLLNVLANDVDIDSAALAIVAVSTPSRGSAVIDGAAIRYTPNAGYSGADSFTYTISDGAATATATVSLTVRAVNRAPNAVADNFAVAEDSTANVLAVRANDSDPDNDVLALVSVTTPANGTTAISGGSIVYSPAANFSGVDVFTYTISDGVLNASAAVTVTVLPVNDAPLAAPDRYSVNEDSTGNLLSVLANDGDVDGDVLSIVAAGTPTNGSVTITPAGILYTPAPNYNGQDAFRYTISDSILTSTATVSLTVQPVNDTPVARNDSFTVNAGSSANVLAVRANDSDIDGDALAIVAVGSTANGSVTHDGAVVRYTPNTGYVGADSFTYTISDGALTATARVDLTVQAVTVPRVALALHAERSGANADGVITVGQAVTLVATITNTGASVLDVVPLRMTADTAVVQLARASITPDSTTSGLIVWNDVSGAAGLAPGQRLSVRITFTGTGSSSTLPDRVLAVDAAVDGAVDSSGQVAPPASSRATLRVTAPRVAISTRMIDPAGGELKAGQLLTMSVRITNTGDVVVAQLPLRDRFDSNVLSFVRASVTGGKVSGSGASAQVAWTDLTTILGDLAPGQSTEVLITYRIRVVFWSSVRQSLIENARSEFGDALPNASASVTIYCMKLELTLTAQPPAGSRVPRNAEIFYTLRVRTPGEAPLTNLVLRAAVAGDGAFVVQPTADGLGSAVRSESTCPVRVVAPSNANAQTWSLDRLGAGASCTVTFKTKVAAARVAGFLEVRVEGMAAELLAPATTKVRHSVTTSIEPDVSSFAAASDANAVEVIWTAIAEDDVTGYHVWRSPHNELSIAERVTARMIEPERAEQSFYELLDSLPAGAETMYYWLEVVRPEGSSYIGPVYIAPTQVHKVYLPLAINMAR